MYLNRGVLFAFGAAGLFGASIPVAKLLLESGLDSRLMAGLLYLGSGLGLAGSLLARRLFQIPSSEPSIRRSDAGVLTLVIASGGIIAPLLLTWGLARTAAASASLLLNLEGVTTLIIAWLFFRENADWRILLGAAAILVGAVVISWDGSLGGLDWGSAAIAAACVGWAIDNNLTRKLSGSDPVQIAAWKGLAAGTFNVALAVALGARFPSAGLTVATGFVGLAGYGASLVLFVLALRHLGVARTGAYYTTAPFIGAVLAFALLGEPLSFRVFLAGILMLLGVLLHIFEVHAHSHRHEPLQHEHRHTHDVHHRHSHQDLPPSDEEHTHLHRHDPDLHSHPHYPDLHHRHGHAEYPAKSGQDKPVA